MNSLWPSVLRLCRFDDTVAMSCNQSVSDLWAKQPTPLSNTKHGEHIQLGLGLTHRPRIGPTLYDRCFVFDTIFFANHSSSLVLVVPPKNTPPSVSAPTKSFQRPSLNPKSQVLTASLIQLVQLMDLAHYYIPIPIPWMLFSQPWSLQSTHHPAVFTLPLADLREQPLI